MSSKMDDKTIDDVIRIASALKDIIGNSIPDTWTLLCAISLAMIDGSECKPQPEKPSTPRSTRKERQEECRLEPPPAPPNRSIRDWWCWWWQPELKRTKGDDAAHAR